MFQKIVLRRSEKGNAISLGELAQAMFFYQHVQIIFDRETVIMLFKTLGASRFLSLIARENISSVYVEDELAVQDISKEVNHYGFTSFTVMGNATGVRHFTPEERLASQLVEFNNISQSDAFSFSIKFFKKVRVRTYLSDYFISKGIINSAQIELTETNLLHEATRRTIENFIGTQEVGAFEIEAKLVGKNGFTIKTNLDFQKINRNRKNKDSLYELNLGNLLLGLLISKSDNLIAAFYDGDIYTSDLSSRIISIRHQEIIKKVTGNKDEVRLFEEIVLNNASPIKDLIDSNQKTFDDFLLILNKAEPFREWTANLTPEKKMVAEYMDRVNSIGWSNSTTIKSLRFLICTGLGIIEPITGTALSFADAFLLDKLVKGWRPHQFVEKDLKPFVNLKK